MKKFFLILSVFIFSFLNFNQTNALDCEKLFKTQKEYSACDIQSIIDLYKDYDTNPTRDSIIENLNKINEYFESAYFEVTDAWYGLLKELRILSYEKLIIRWIRYDDIKDVEDFLPYLFEYDNRNFIYYFASAYMDIVIADEKDIASMKNSIENAKENLNNASRYSKWRDNRFIYDLEDFKIELDELERDLEDYIKNEEDLFLESQIKDVEDKKDTDKEVDLSIIENEEIKIWTKIVFEKIKDIVWKKSLSQQKIIYLWLKENLSKYKTIFSWDRLLTLNYLLELIENEL